MGVNEAEPVILEEKLKQLVKDATIKFLGVSIDKLAEDITAKLSKSTFADIKINKNIGYKKAKKLFKKDFLTRMLVLHLGNVSEVAKILGTDRRSVHRLINDFMIDLKKIKRELLRPYDIRMGALSMAIGDVLHDYRGIIHPKRLEEMYRNVSTLSEDIMKDLPEPKLTMKMAEKMFDREYLKYHLNKNGKNISKTAKSIGLRFETLHRKLKKIAMI